MHLPAELSATQRLTRLFERFIDGSWPADMPSYMFDDDEFIAVNGSPAVGMPMEHMGLRVEHIAGNSYLLFSVRPEHCDIAHYVVSRMSASGDLDITAWLWRSTSRAAAIFHDVINSKSKGIVVNRVWSSDLAESIDDDRMMEKLKQDCERGGTG